MTKITEMETGARSPFGSTPKDRTNVIGWYRWGYGKYHAFLTNHPNNSKSLITGRLTTWSACNINGTNILADFTLDPPIEKRCRTCMKNLGVNEND
jgi:hypothetical protein